MTKHSPGPWKTIEHSWSDTSIVSTEDGIIVTLSILDEATEDTQEAFQDRMKANALLMASAPDLLNALESMVNKATKQNWNDMYPDQLEEAMAAIDKARGI